MTSYKQALADHAYLWSTYGPAEDMSGGYVDQADLAKMLRRPTEATARDCLESQIHYWFSVGPDNAGHLPIDPDDERLIEIADRYCEEIPS